MSKVKIEDRVSALVGEGKTLSLVRATLLVEGFKPKDIAAATKGLATSRAGGFAADYYAWLAEKPRGEKEIEAYILAEDNSENVKNHLSHYKAIGMLTMKVWAAKK